MSLFVLLLIIAAPFSLFTNATVCANFLFALFSFALVVKLLGAKDGKVCEAIKRELELFCFSCIFSTYSRGKLKKMKVKMEKANF